LEFQRVLSNRPHQLDPQLRYKLTFTVSKKSETTNIVNYISE